MISYATDLMLPTRKLKFKEQLINLKETRVFEEKVRGQEGILKCNL